MSAPKLPAFEEYKSQLDMEAVAEAILDPAKTGVSAVAQDDFIDAKRCVWSAANHWFARDLRDLAITTVEEEEFLEVEGVVKPTKMYLDVQGFVTPDAGKPFDRFAGQKMVVDWKSTAGGLDDRWRSRYIDSHQWKIYSLKAEAALFTYRGISRRWDSLQKRCDTREIILVVPYTNAEEVTLYLQSSDIQRQALLKGGLTVWPQDFRRCNDWGRECPFYDDCTTWSMPRFVPEDRPMSYSRLSDFYACPERHRRMLGLAETDFADDTDFSNFGNLVHAGMAELYRQGKELQNGKTRNEII